MDFVKIRQQAIKGGVTEVFADFQNKRCKDLMVRGGDFYAMWDDINKIWVEDEFDVASTIDDLLFEYANNLMKNNPDQRVKVRTLGNTAGGGFKEWRNYIKDLPDMYKILNPKIMYAGDNPVREDYSTRNVPYFLREGSYDAYEELISTLYSPEERDKFEWAIGCVLSGDVKRIQKFLVFYGGAGTGKSTVIKIIEHLFEGYCSAFKASDLTSRNNGFALEAFANNPMVAIQHDGDLSKIEDNTLLNSIVSHEKMQVNQKYKTPYDMIFNTFLIMGTNTPVRITDSKSGITRRLIDVVPTGNLVSQNRYDILMEHILDNELGAIAYYCLDKYRNMGKGYYSHYKPLEMMYKTDAFYNFISENYDDFSTAEYVTVQRAYDMYKKYCEDTLVPYPLSKMKFKEELKSYFLTYKERHYDKNTDTQARSVVMDFDTDKFTAFKQPEPIEPKTKSYISLTLDCRESLLDEVLANCPAQYANEDGFPMYKWENVTTTLADIDTTKLHYVRPPDNHIVIDFDIKDDKGNKSKELNLLEASKWPATYTEYSKSGGGIHLHYIYEGDIETLAPIYAHDIEVKRFLGKSALRRQLSKCNENPVTTLSKELPKREEKMINSNEIKNEAHLRNLISKALKKEIHPSTKPNIDYICFVLTKAFDNDMQYDVSDMQGDVETFALDSSNQSEYCIRAISKLHFKNLKLEVTSSPFLEDSELYFYDIEVKPNLLLVCYKKHRLPAHETTVLVNPEPEAMAHIISLPLVGFNNKAYDNHIIYARYMGYTIEQCYQLSKSMIKDRMRPPFYQGYKLGYADIFSMVPQKQGLKQWELDLDISHVEADVDWDAECTPEELERLKKYCINDVYATEKVWDANRKWVVTRQMLAAMTGGSMMDATNKLTQLLVFGDDPEPQKEFNIPDLSIEFPGYDFKQEWVDGKLITTSLYKGFETGTGGFNFSNVGMWRNVKAFDVASMHPSSIIAMNMFGPRYTPIFKELMDLRLICKHGRLDEARTAMNGLFANLITTVEDCYGLAESLKIAINSVYGMTYSAFDTKFMDKRNVDNIVAKRGALFMIDLKEKVESLGYTVVHIKTDCIKVADADECIEKFIFDYGQDYGYTFEIEEVFEKFALINAASYMGRLDKPLKNGDIWDARTATFKHPYVWSKLTGKGNPPIEDVREDKSVAGNAKIYVENEQGVRQFIGKCGSFVPVKSNGYNILRVDGEKIGAVTGTKDYKWMEWSIYKSLPNPPEIDWSYYHHLYEAVYDELSKYGDVEDFLYGA